MRKILLASAALVALSTPAFAADTGSVAQHGAATKKTSVTATIATPAKPVLSGVPLTANNVAFVTQVG
jgi:hypothetical protein